MQVLACFIASLGVGLGYPCPNVQILVDVTHFGSQGTVFTMYSPNFGIITIPKLIFTAQHGARLHTLGTEQDN
jgi:hypothetical protein